MCICHAVILNLKRAHFSSKLHTEIEIFFFLHSLLLHNMPSLIIFAYIYYFSSVWSEIQANSFQFCFILTHIHKIGPGNTYSTWKLFVICRCACVCVLISQQCWPEYSLSHLCSSSMYANWKALRVHDAIFYAN